MFFLIFLRVGAIMVSAPFFESKNIPILFKMGLSLAISIILFPVLRLDNIPFYNDVIPFGIGVLGEMTLGVIIGLSIKLIFSGIQLAGQLVGFQMGFAIVNIMDPVTSTRLSLTAQLNNLVALLIFLSINAHHWLLRALADSFQLVPPFDFRFNNSLMAQLMKIASNMFIIAIKVAAPVMAALLLTSVALGLVARTVPQMNILIVAFPLKIVVGLLFFAFSLPYLLSFLEQIFGGLGSDMLFLLKTI